MTFLEEKIYDLITKMCNEMQNGFANVRGDITNIQGDINDLKKGQIKLEVDTNDLKKGQIKLENDLKEAKTALFDGYRQTYEKLESVEQKVDNLAAIVESHDVKIEVIRRTK
jgi:predicted  nucleic acid-binding Zn-ribbon protein